MKKFYVNGLDSLYTVNGNYNQEKKKPINNEISNAYNNTAINQNSIRSKKNIITIKGIISQSIYNANNGNDNNNHNNKQLYISSKRGFNFKKNINPTHMKYNNGSSGMINKNSRAINRNILASNKVLSINENNIYYKYNNNNIKNNNLRNSVSVSNNINNNSMPKFSKKKMGISQINFYNANTYNNYNYFPNIHNQRPNLNSINDIWLQQQKVYYEFYNNMQQNNPHPIINNQNKNEQFIRIFDLDYRRPEEKLKKGQNQLILERLQKKYMTRVREKSQNMRRTGTDFYPNKILKGRQYSAQDSTEEIFKGIVNSNTNRLEYDYYSKEKNKNNKNNGKTTLGVKNNNINNTIKKEQKFNKTYNGFNIKKNNNKERRKKEKKIFLKIIKYFNKKTNYLWKRYFNKKRKMKYLAEEEENIIKKKNKSFDSNIFKKSIKYYYIMHNKKKHFKKKNLKYNTDNSEIDEIKEYKKYKKKYKTNDSAYANFIKTKNNKEEDKNKNDYYSSDSEQTDDNKNEPKFKGIFDNDNKNNEKNNNIKNEEYKNKNDKRRFNFNTTSNFYTKNNYNFNKNTNDEKKNGKDEDKKYKEDYDKEKNNKFNIENIINNVIENNKRAAAARSSTSFYNIGSHFMNNHMRSTKTKFYNPKENRGGGGFTGTKDSNFTKEQANDFKSNKPNSLKITLINPISWRKHEEIWDNLVTLSMGFMDLEKYLMPPNETDVLVSSYLKMNPRILNFCSIQKINSSNTKNENNFISFMIDDNIQNPKQEIKKWKEAYKRVIFRWHPDKLSSILEDVKLKNEQQKNELKKKSSLILNNTNTLYKCITEILNKILSAKEDKENNNN